VAVARRRWPSERCVVVLDEIDKLRDLKGEGDADSLAAKRVSTYGEDFKLLRFSKPTVEGESRIARHFERGSMASLFHRVSRLRRVSTTGVAIVTIR